MTVVNARDFGAIGDGVHDDAEPILNACVAAAKASRAGLGDDYSGMLERFADVDPSSENAWQEWLNRGDQTELWAPEGYPAQVYLPTGTYRMCRPLLVRVQRFCL